MRAVWQITSMLQTPSFVTFVMLNTILISGRKSRKENPQKACFVKCINIRFTNKSFIIDFFCQKIESGYLVAADLIQHMFRFKCISSKMDVNEECIASLKILPCVIHCINDIITVKAVNILIWSLQQKLR